MNPTRFGFSPRGREEGKRGIVLVDKLAGWGYLSNCFKTLLRFDVEISSDDRGNATKLVILPVDRYHISSCSSTKGHE